MPPARHSARPQPHTQCSSPSTVGPRPIGAFTLLLRASDPRPVLQHGSPRRTSAPLPRFPPRCGEKRDSQPACLRQLRRRRDKAPAVQPYQRYFTVASQCRAANIPVATRLIAWNTRTVRLTIAASLAAPCDRRRPLIANSQANNQAGDICSVQLPWIIAGTTPIQTSNSAIQLSRDGCQCFTAPLRIALGASSRPAAKT